MTGDKTILTDSAAPYGTAYHATSPPAHPAAAIIEPNNNSITTEPAALNQQQIEYREKVQALHACKLPHKKKTRYILLIMLFRSSKS